MIDFQEIEKYKENNRIEAKRATGGFPGSLWETYSAFANTLGGVILLGVEEFPDKSLHPVKLPYPEGLVLQFWAEVNDPEKVSVNILSEENVSVIETEGKRIVAITVPRAMRYDRPVYINGSAAGGTYRRNGEGDYRCSPGEVQAMARDAALKSQDMKILEYMGLESLDMRTVTRYRQRMRQSRPGHAWELLDHGKFLYRLGAAGRGADRRLHPTAAGLLMFGRCNEICREYPEYDLVYREEGDCGTVRKTLRSGVGGLENVFDFYSAVSEELLNPDNSEEVNGAMEEAMANCLINTDYYGIGGVEISKRNRKVVFSNPGSFRLELEEARAGGISDPRNEMLIKMFKLVNVGEGAGKGIPNIFAVWNRQGWAAPRLKESFDPDRITLELEFSGSPAVSRIPRRGKSGRTLEQAAVIEYLTANVSAAPGNIAELLNVTGRQAREVLAELEEKEIVTAEGRGRGRRYRLKA